MVDIFSPLGIVSWVFVMSIVVFITEVFEWSQGEELEILELLALLGVIGASALSIICLNEERKAKK